MVMITNTAAAEDATPPRAGRDAHRSPRRDGADRGGDPGVPEPRRLEGHEQPARRRSRGRIGDVAGDIGEHMGGRRREQRDGAVTPHRDGDEVGAHLALVVEVQAGRPGGWACSRVDGQPSWRRVDRGDLQQHGGHPTGRDAAPPEHGQVCGYLRYERPGGQADATSRVEDPARRQADDTTEGRGRGREEVAAHVEHQVGAATGDVERHLPRRTDRNDGEVGCDGAHCEVLDRGEWDTGAGGIGRHVADPLCIGHRHVHGDGDRAVRHGRARTRHRHRPSLSCIRRLDAERPRLSRIERAIRRHRHEAGRMPDRGRWSPRRRAASTAGLRGQRRPHGRVGRSATILDLVGVVDEVIELFLAGRVTGVLERRRANGAVGGDAVRVGHPFRQGAETPGHHPREQGQEAAAVGARHRRAREAGEGGGDVDVLHEVAVATGSRADRVIADDQRDVEDVVVGRRFALPPVLAPVETLIAAEDDQGVGEPPGVGESSDDRPDRVIVGEQRLADVSTLVVERPGLSRGQQR